MNIYLDNLPVPEGVFIRTIEKVGVSHTIKTIIDIQLKFEYVPEILRCGRTVLIYKGKGANDNRSFWNLRVFHLTKEEKIENPVVQQ